MNSRSIIGACILVVGALLLLNQFGIAPNLGFLWPIFLLVPGVLFYVGYYQKRSSADNFGLLIPGTILIIYSLYFFINQATDYRFAGELSFMFILGVSLAFFAAYYLPTSHRRGLLIPAWILLGISIINFLGAISSWDWWPILLIVLGIYLLYSRQQPKNKPSVNHTTNDHESANQQSNKPKQSE
ncbi:MAG: LiaF transmembrane domain-containing protein [Patescibacteria group bacterium]